ncbi:hypothetical protein GGH92_001386 [Coemansia sp. RSA 2673]|nr:hypothetical protein GGH92_001386 [Coemansia sp. RSA 2673]
MTRPSSFQTLPILVTELIVDYVAGKETKVSGFNPAEVGTHSAIRRAESEAEGRLLRQLPLLWACSSFRAVVLANYCKRCAIRFIGSRRNRRAVTRNNWPGRLKNLDIPVHLLAKELLMEVSLRDIYLGHTLGMLLLQYNIARVFPKVRSLEFQFTLIYADPDIAANSRRIMTNIGSFTRYIGQVVPMVRTVSVSLSYISNRVPQTRVPFFGDLVSQLYRLAGHIEYCRNCHTVPVELQPTIISDLTTMDCHVDGNIESLMALVRRNASTLQSLTTRSLMYVDISGLVRDPSGGGYVQYTGMRMLKLHHFTNSVTSQHAVFDGALPFPRLHSLQVLYNFPFGDDMLFRGNAKTLEYLHIQLDDLSVSVFQRYRVFTPVSHPKLRRVKIQHAKGRKPSTLSTTSDYLRFVLNISSNATVCSFYDVSGVLGLQSELLLFDDYRHIRVLDMPNAFIATTSPDAESNISAFVKRVKQIATKLEKIGIILSPHDNEPPSPIQQLNDLVQQLCQQAVDIEYEVSRQPVILDQRLNGLRNLVYVSFDSTDGGEQIVQLVRRNASTLQSLDVLESTITNVNGLILNDDGSYMQYPCMHTLKFSGRRGPNVPRLLVFPGAVPFPSLRKLSIGFKCLFGDDTLFRGNAATLETLSLSPSPTSARVIREYRVFTPVSHPKLQYVRFGVISDSEPNIFDTDIEYLRFVLSIGPNAPVRAIYDRFIGLEFQSLIPAFGEHTCIQVLALEGLHLNLWDAIALVTALPLLSDLRTLLPVLGPLPNGVAKHKLPAYVIANYAPTGKRFRCWSYGYSLDGNGFKEAVRCVLLLALVCPNFDYAAVGLSGELFMAHMKEMITTDGFRPYAARLRRLLFGGAKNKIRSVKGLLAVEEAARARWEGRV